MVQQLFRVRIFPLLAPCKGNSMRLNPTCQQPNLNKRNKSLFVSLISSTFIFPSSFYPLQ